MVFARRTALLRLTAMAALVVSAILISDHMNPDRAFCPMEEACEAARSSALGSLFGIPTSILGMVAFGGLFFLTLLPVEWGRRLLQVAGFFAALAGAGFIVYQAIVLRTFCPLCLVADGAGLVAGLITLTWPKPPIRASGRRLGGEGATGRLAWTLAGVLAVVVPFAWPRPDAPSWVEIPEQAMADFEDVVPEPDAVTTSGPDPFEPPATDTGPEPTPVPVQIHPTAVVSTNQWRQPPPTHPGRDRTTPAPATPRAPAPKTEPSATEPPSLAVTPGPRSAAPAPTHPRPAAPSAPTVPVAGIEGPDPTGTPAAAVPTPKPATRTRRGPVIVEYLNAYCAHCRATHVRLEKVLKEMGIEVRRRRIYAWATNGYPLWVRACCYARKQGLEERFFEELMRAPSQNASQIYAAARRAGLDVVELQCSMKEPTIPEDLRRDCDRMRTAGLKGLPTLDIGRRRLMGEQSESELREAIRAAMRQSGRP